MRTIALDIDKGIVQYPVKAIGQLNNSERKILDLLIGLSCSYATVHVSQSTLGSWINLTRRQINRIIAKLASLGIIAKFYRNYSTCIYEISSFFRPKKTRLLLKNLLPNIVNLSSLTLRNLFSFIRENHMNTQYIPLINQRPLNPNDPNHMTDQQVEERLLKQLEQLEKEIPYDKFNKIMDQGRTLKQKVDIAERYAAGLRLLRRNPI